MDLDNYRRIIGHTGGVMGLLSYNFCKEIERKYPEEFPWQTLHDSIPKEVHEAYYTERHACFREMFERKQIDNSPGIIPSIIQYKVGTNSPKSLNELIRQLFDMEDDIDAKNKADLQKDKELWDKHYKKYGLEFRP